MAATPGIHGNENAGEPRIVFSPCRDSRIKTASVVNTIVAGRAENLEIPWLLLAHTPVVAVMYL